MISVTNLCITLHSERKLIENCSFFLTTNDKLAIIGEEGNGKSTILKAIACPQEILSYAKIDGNILVNGASIGYLEQNLSIEWNNQTVHDYLMKEKPFDEIDYNNYNNFFELEKYFLDFKLSISLLDSEQAISSLSGGEKVKIQLIKILLKDPDILFLDEPTNDIDLSTLIWLESFLNSTTKPIIFVSHDEQLLENTANCILHIEQTNRKRNSKCTFARITYGEYIIKRTSDLTKQAQVAVKERQLDAIKMEKWRRINEKVEKELNTISRGDPHGAQLLKKKMKTVKAQEKRFERERKEFTDFPDPEEAISLNFGYNSLPKRKIVLELGNQTIQIDDKTLAKDLNLTVYGQDRIVIVGNNGVGKSTLIKHLYQLLENREDIVLGYMPQNYNDYFDLEATVIDFVSSNFYTKEELTRIRTFLGCLKFTKDEIEHKISDISGGQKAKLYLAKLMIKNANVLLLDEPTRNLSPLSNPVIREALRNYQGCIISVSHDRKFIQEVAERVLEFTKDGFIQKEKSSITD